MAQFDLYRLAGGDGLIIDCQSDLLGELTTRFVLPLVAEEEAGRLVGRLNPVLPIEGTRYVLMAHLPAALPRAMLRNPIGSAREYGLIITAAIDMLTGGV